MSSRKSVGFEQILSSLVGRTILVILTVMVIAPCLSLVYLLDLYGGFTQVTFLVQAGLGIVSGLVARWLLRKQGRGLQLAAALAAMIIGQCVLGFISKGVLGMSLDIDELFRGSTWYQLIQALWSATVTSLVILAWNGKRQPGQAISRIPAHKDNSDELRNLTEFNSQERQNLIPRMKIYLKGLVSGNNFKKSSRSNQRNHVQEEDARSRFSQQPARVHSTRDKENQQQLRMFPKRPFLIKAWMNNAGHWIQSQDISKKIWTWIIKTKRAFLDLFTTTHRNPENNKRKKIRFPVINIGNSNLIKFSQSRTPTKVKLVGEEEHICPYCLEEVTPQDRRGLKKCPICKTWHHADCWAEVGECQVPHYQR